MTPNVSAACDAAGVARKTAYARRESDPAFAAAWTEALEIGIDALEAECVRRAQIGVKRGVWMKDANGTPIQVETVTDFSDRLALALLRAHRPERYRETFRAEVTGSNGKPVDNPAMEHLSEAELRGIVAAYEASKAAPFLKIHPDLFRRGIALAEGRVDDATARLTESELRSLIAMWEAAPAASKKPPSTSMRCGQLRESLSPDQA